MSAVITKAILGVAMRDEFDGEWVRAARQRKGWTQLQLAQALGVTAPNVSHWENGIAGVKPRYLRRISELTGHPLWDWPLPEVPLHRITRLSPERLQALQVVMLVMLKALEEGDTPDGFLAALQPRI